MRLMLVRHGETLYNVERRYTGQSDIPLSTRGTCEAVTLGAYLASEHLDVVVASDLQRTRATAQSIAQHHALPVLEDADLREMAMGDWEGCTYVEIMARDAELVAHWKNDPSHYAAGGGETLVQLQDRVMRALERWQTQYPEGTVLWVTHGGVIAVLVCQLLEMDLNRRWQFYHANGSITEFRLSNQHRPILVRSNETAHLHNL